MSGHLKHRERGAALLFVLWIITLLSIIAGSFGQTAKRESDFLAHAHERSQTKALADGAIRYSVLMLTLPDPAQRWWADGTPYRWETEEGQVEIRIFDEAGKLNINAVQEPVLRSVLSLLVKDADTASTLADSILDWRDADSDRRPQGAELKDYLDPIRPKPQNRNFINLEEVRSVRGVSPELFQKIKPWFTVYTGQGGINFQKASKELLLTLSGDDKLKVETFLREKRLGITPNFQSATGIPAQNEGDLIYTLLLQAKLDGSKSGIFISATVLMTPGGDPEPFVFISYEQRAFHTNPNKVEPVTRQ